MTALSWPLVRLDQSVPDGPTPEPGGLMSGALTPFDEHCVRSHGQCAAVHANQTVGELDPRPNRHRRPQLALGATSRLLRHAERFWWRPTITATTTHAGTVAVDLRHESRRPLLGASLNLALCLYVPGGGDRSPAINRGDLT